jgi:hypothetical protein
MQCYKLNQGLLHPFHKPFWRILLSLLVTTTLELHEFVQRVNLGLPRLNRFKVESLAFAPGTYLFVIGRRNRLASPVINDDLVSGLAGVPVDQSDTLEWSLKIALTLGEQEISAGPKSRPCVVRTNPSRGGCSQPDAAAELAIDVYSVGPAARTGARVNQFTTGEATCSTAKLHCPQCFA